MTLEQAVKRLEEKGMWFEGRVPAHMNEDGFSWFVWRQDGDLEYSQSECLGEGRTWQEAYAEAMGEAPF